ncbi:MAG: ABC transporter permease [Acidobacteria bacterium]|nr:ABC transporter permease [Acidobacteriota bacterium]
MDKFSQEFRYALRQLRKAPGFTITAVLTLAFGIGANVAVFSVMNAVLLNPSGLPNPRSLVALRAKYSFGGLSNISISAPDFQDALEGRKVFESAAIMLPASFNYSGSDGRPVRIQAALVSWQWFDVFQVKPALGRGFHLEDDQPEANYSIVLSHQAWQSLFGADPNIVGRKVQLNEHTYQVIGVMGPEFAWPNTAQFWTPIALPQKQFFDNQNFRHNENFFGVARLRPGVTLDQANLYLATRVQEQIEREGSNSFSKSSGWGMFSVPLLDFVAGNLRKPLLLLLGAVALVLLIASLNIAGLQLARASDRERETSIRVALGAPGGRLVAQAFLESLLLACGGLAVGLALAEAGIPALLLLAPQSLVRNLEVHLQAPVLAFVAAIVIVAVILCGSAPAWQMTRFRWVQALREGGRSDNTSQARQRLRAGLVVCEIAVAMLLLVSAGLLVSSLKKVEQVSTGFDPSGVMTARVSLPRTIYGTDEKKAAFFAGLLDQLRNIPGASNATIADSIPFDGQGGSASFQIKEKPVGPDDPGPHAVIRAISADYFRSLRIPLLAGREFTPADRNGTEQVAVVDDTLARQYFPSEDPIGKHIGFGGPNATWYTVVGIARHARVSSLDADTSEGIYYLPMAQTPASSATLLVRTKLSQPQQLRSGIENAVHAVDPNEPVYDFNSLEELVESSLVSRRFLVILLSTFAALSLFLSVLGLYGVVSYMVKMRVREIGVRMALGAQRSDVLLLVLKKGVELAVAGSILGIFVTFVLGQALSSLLYQVKLYNPTTLLSMSALLGVVVLLASYLPAYRASRLQPLDTLRDN